MPIKREKKYYLWFLTLFSTIEMEKRNDTNAGFGWKGRREWIIENGKENASIFLRIQEQLDKVRDALLNTKKQNHVLNDKLQNLLRSQDESELRITELDKHIRSLQEVTEIHSQWEMPLNSIVASASLSMSQESQCDFVNPYQSQTLRQREQEIQEAQDGGAFLRREKGELEERVNTLQSSLQGLQEDKTQLEKTLARLGKDKSSLKRTLEKVHNNLKHEHTVCIQQRDTI